MKNKKPKDNKINKKSDRALPFSKKFVGLLADEVAKTIVHYLPKFPKSKKNKPGRKIENAVLLDTSAIIDQRVFDVIKIGALSGTYIVLESILVELKHIADSSDMIKRERGRRGMEALDKLKKSKGIKFLIFSDAKEKSLGINNIREVDEKLVKAGNLLKARIITCDYNLEKRANILGVVAVNINTLANFLKVIAVPGDSLCVSIRHKGKDETQGVGYLDDGTMIVVENASSHIGNKLDITISRVIQTAAGRILFAKKD